MIDPLAALPACSETRPSAAALGGERQVYRLLCRCRGSVEEITALLPTGSGAARAGSNRSESGIVQEPTYLPVAHKPAVI